MSLLAILSYVAIVLLIAVLAFFLYWIGSLLYKIAGNLAAANDSVAEIIGHAETIKPGLEHINHTGGVVSGALPLLYGHAERLLGQTTPAAAAATAPRGEGDQAPRSPASASISRRRSRLMETVGFGRR